MLGYDWPRLHAALNDLPAALLLVAVLFELGALALARPALRVASFWTLLAGTVGAALAVVSGLQAEDHIAHGEAVHRLMETHETLGLVTLGVFAVVAVWRLAREHRMSPGERGAALALSVAGVATLVAGAVYGGKMVFDHAAGIPTPVLESEIHERSEGHHHDGADAHGTDEPEGASAADSAAAAAPDSAAAPAPAGHTHAPGTPAHDH